MGNGAELDEEQYQAMYEPDCIERDGENSEETVRAKIKEVLAKREPEAAEWILDDFPIIDLVNDLVFALGRANHVYDPQVIKANGKLFTAVKDRLREYVA